MTFEEFKAQYPTPLYVIEAWRDMHQNFNAQSMRVWEDSCAMAARECRAAYEGSYPPKGSDG